MAASWVWFTPGSVAIVLPPVPADVALPLLPLPEPDDDPAWELPPTGLLPDDTGVMEVVVAWDSFPEAPRLAGLEQAATSRQRAPSTASALTDLPLIHNPLRRAEPPRPTPDEGSVWPTGRDCTHHRGPQ